MSGQYVFSRGMPKRLCSRANCFVNVYKDETEPNGTVYGASFPTRDDADFGSSVVTGHGGSRPAYRLRVQPRFPGEPTT